MGNAPLDARLTALLEEFEERLVESAVASSPFVTEAARHIIGAGGKRFRPLLVFLASHFGGEAGHDDLMRAAKVMELTHVASLYHDDVMDVADVRRGAPSANRMWGNSVAILVGDFLFARASTTVASSASSTSCCRPRPSPAWCRARLPRPRALMRAMTRWRTTSR